MKIFLESFRKWSFLQLNVLDAIGEAPKKLYRFIEVPELISNYHYRSQRSMEWLSKSGDIINLPATD